MQSARAEETAERKVEKARRERPAVRPPSFRGVVARAGIVCLLFFPYLIYIAGEPLDRALFITGVAFVVMIPLGLAIDRMRYRMQTRRQNQAQAQVAESDDE